MKWAFAIQRKIRLAIVLAIMMLFVILFSLMESYNVSAISKSFNSIYEDRLIPAVDLYAISSHIHTKRNKLVTFLFTGKISQKEISIALSSSNKQLDSLISKYENTHLVKAETNHLQNLKKNLKTFERDELLLINAASENKELAKTLYLNTTVQLYDEMDKDLIELTKVQSEIGKELLAESVKSQLSSDFISRLQIIIAIILGLIIMILILTDKQVVLKQEKFNLN
ncbi:MCP four helix bundle domain-containing protein [Daejeonella sp.]|uniref:MCP four helix bundle domain-containing protein n=1 Tax=Daejeonella sp. TaxID=2805397 RepID=UPI00272F1BEF|nr:MCP four helix bundle domain-containing protein [Daejeonella sp.]MDP2413906.1 MCP four helix bundle domain-containing protein [Daejeonella sp.]